MKYAKKRLDILKKEGIGYVIKIDGFCWNVGSYEKLKKQLDYYRAEYCPVWLC